tara:strand:+ start:1680 stop:1964 length:285 start_codon:yes stop_codon:yes gene_type:complete
MKTNQELNALRHRARVISKRTTQAVYTLTLVTVTMVAVAFYMINPFPLVVASITAIAGLVLAYRGERFENEYRRAVYSRHDTTTIKNKKNLNRN